MNEVEYLGFESDLIDKEIKEYNKALSNYLEHTFNMSIETFNLLEAEGQEYYLNKFEKFKRGV